VPLLELSSHPEQLEQEQQRWKEASQIQISPTKKCQRCSRRTSKTCHQNRWKKAKETPELGASYFDQDISRVSLSVNIAPYEDRIIIPKIGKNIPLVNVEHHDANSSNEWHKIFMKELENGIVKYPGSADPGQSGNSFIFGHSSNFPWAKWNYNDVFALLNELDVGDEIIVFFKQKKFVYAVKEKIIVKPGHVSSLAGDSMLWNVWHSWPVGLSVRHSIVFSS
jgi:sortase (surface protein transpeptidase)